MISGFFYEYRWLSNFWPCDILYHNKVYPSVEHAYQAAKTTSESIRDLVRKASTPGIAKKIGKGITLRHGWNDWMKLETMHILVEYKFNHHIDMKEKLLNTGENKLIEENSWGDTYWGVCRGIGENNLGIILMEIRSKLK